MEKSDLEKLLKGKGIPEDAYTLLGGIPNEKFCLENRKNIWEVYYSERGIKTDLRQFDSESDACEYLYRKLLSIFCNGEEDGTFFVTER